MTSEAVEIDATLLRGFSFACRPDCGLCCYAEPLVSAPERAELLRLEPAPRFVERGRHTLLAARPDGGPCVLLEGTRCRGHAARPAPCREFPVAVHVGERLQATVVLSCPGLDLTALDRYGDGRSLPDASGLDSELESVRRRAASHAARLLDTCARRLRSAERRLRAEGRWDDPEELRARLESAPPWPDPEDLEADDLPEPDAGLSFLPLFFDGRPAPVALARAAAGVELLALAPDGGVETSLGVAPELREIPALAPEAERALVGYLRYWLRRDALVAMTVPVMLEHADGRLGEWVEAELRAIGATVLARAHAIATVRRGPVERLTGEEVRQGIRATDQDLLDRPTLGSPL